MVELSVTTKTYLVLGIIVTCFAILYPKILHPMLMITLGLQSNEPNYVTTTVRQANEFYPHDGSSSHPQLQGGSGAPKPLQQKQLSQKGGILTMILPLYALGIVIYLVYTLIKVMSNKTPAMKNKKEELLKNYYKNFHYDPVTGNFKMDSQTTDDYFGGGLVRDPDRINDPRTYEDMHRDLEKLLQKVDEQNMSEEELLQLKSRLESTEEQMSSILSAMRGMQSKVTG